jgi:choline dehydrogenase-like flavoprotein
MIKNGRRISASLAFLRPARRRPNLMIAINTTVNRVLFEGE